MAWFEAASDDAALFRDGAAEKEADVQEWLRHCLSTSCLIKVVDSLGELQWVSAQLREDMSQLAVLQRTPTQRIFDVVSKKESMGTNFTAEALVQLYDKKLKWSSTAEKTVNWLLVYLICRFLVLCSFICFNFQGGSSVHLSLPLGFVNSSCLIMDRALRIEAVLKIVLLEEASGRSHLENRELAARDCQQKPLVQKRFSGFSNI